MALTSRRLAALAAALFTLAACGGSSGNTPPDPQCNTPAECPGTDTACRTRTCTGGTCGFSFAADTVVVESQTAGDCQMNRCDGAGGVHAVADDADVPADDGNPCTAEACAGGVPVHPPLAANTPCTQGGAYCDGAGSCVECTAAAQCGSDTECRTFTCLAGVCGVEDPIFGTAISAQTPGDCRSNVCDGSGGVTSAPLGTDVPADDGNPCTAEVCDAGAPAHPARVGQACSEGDGRVCDGAGACVQCLGAADCGVTTACKTFTCDAGVCGHTVAAPGTLVANPTVGDCRTDRCDGDGNLVADAVDDTDLPADDGNPCTAEVCSSGHPGHPVLAPSTACHQGGGKVCDGAGACVQCLTAADCGATTACKTFTCAAGVCGSTNTAAGTLVANPTVGDCRTDRCDGAGNLVADAVDDTDLPGDDGNQCTGEICTAGHPTHPTAASGTACNQGGGTKCDGAAHCVQCLSSADCSGGNVCDGAGTCRSQPAVAATTPADGGFAAASTAVSITFTEAMAPATLTAQSAGTSCSGTIQLSADDFADCAAFSSTTPTMTDGNRTATLIPAVPLPLSSTYKLRVTTGALSALGIALSTPYTSPHGFTVPPRKQVEFCILQWPPALSAAPASTTESIYGQIFESGVTEADGASPTIVAQVGYGPVGVNPAIDPGWTWSAATYGSQKATSDEYVASLLAPATGDYWYTYRFSADAGTTWTYCDRDGSGSGAASFDPAMLGVMTVKP